MKKINAILIIVMLFIGLFPVDVFAGTSSTVVCSATWIDNSIENDAETGCGYIEWMRFTASFGDKIVKFTDSKTHLIASNVGNRVSGTIYLKIVGGSTGITYAEWTKYIPGDDSGDYTLSSFPTVNCNDSYLSVYCKQDLTYNNAGTTYVSRIYGSSSGSTFTDSFTLYLVDQYLSDSSYYAQLAASNAATASSNATVAANAANTASTNAINALNAVSNANGNTVTAVRDASGTVLSEARQAKTNAQNAYNSAQSANTNAQNAYNTAQTVNSKVDALTNAVNDINTSIIGVNDDNSLIVSAVRDPDGTVLSVSKDTQGAVEDANGNTVSAVRDGSGTVLDEARQGKINSQNTMDSVASSDGNTISAVRDTDGTVLVASRSNGQKIDALQTTVNNFMSMDTTAPEVNLRTLSGAWATSGSSIKVVVNAADNVSTVFQYSLDETMYQPLPADGVVLIPVSNPGANLITIWVKDDAGNIGRNSITIRRL